MSYFDDMYMNYVEIILSLKEESGCIELWRESNDRV